MTTPRPTPTLTDVAGLAQVSTATVSRCLNEPDKVAKATRDKVLAAVSQLGYTPNYAARVMASRRSNTIGAIIPTMENAIFARGLQAFQEELRNQGYTLLVASSSYDPAIEAEQIRTLVARGADGLFLIGSDRDAEARAFLDTQGVPTVVAWTLINRPGQATIGFDNHAAMVELAQAVIQRGHRRLGVISAPIHTNDRAKARVEAVISAAHAHGISKQNIPVIETPYSIDNGASALDQLICRPKPPTAILCGNDVLAIGALRAARARGLNVPKDVSITGFDDIELAQVAVPPLTTVHVPDAEMGRAAAQLLLGMVKGEAMAETVALKTTLRIRQSLGDAPG